jgi:hypothetical protein
LRAFGFMINPFRRSIEWLKINKLIIRKKEREKEGEITFE